MAVGYTTERVEDADTGNVTTYQLGSAFTPGANSLLILAISATDSVATYDVSSISEAGMDLTWNVVQSQEVNNGTAYQRGAVYYALVGGSPSSTTVSVTFSEAVTGCIGWIGEFSGHSTTNPIRQSDMLTLGSGTETHSLDNAVVSGSMSVYVHCGERNPPALDASGDSWTEVCDTGYNTPANGLFVAYKAGDQTIAFTGTDLADVTSIILEINPSGGAVVTSTAAAAATSSISTSAEFWSIFERQVAAAATSGVSSSGEFWTVFERAIAAAAVSSIATSGEVAAGFDIYEAAVAAGATSSITTAGQRELLRQVAASAASGIATAPERDLLRSVAATAVSSIVTDYERDLLRAASASASSSVVVSDFERDLLRSTSSSASSGAAVSGEVIHVFERAVSLSGISGIATSGEIGGAIFEAAVAATATSSVEVAFLIERAVRWLQRYSDVWPETASPEWDADGAASWPQEPNPPDWD